MKHSVSFGSHRGFLFSILAATALGAGSVQAQTQPPNSLSITTYGATTGAADNKTAIQNCINAAQSQGRGVWIPAGTWRIQSSLSATDVTISGAGMNSSIIYRQQNSSSIVATELSLLRCTVRDIGLAGNGTARGVNASYGINMKGVGWLVERVRVANSDAAMWLSGSNGTVQNCTIVTAYADGINLNNSNGPNGVGANLTAQNNTINGTGDDSIAINSQGISLGRQNMQSPKVLFNTITGTFGANGLRIAGGVNSQMMGNSVSDTTANAENGIQVGKFGGDGFLLVNGSVTGNTFTRVGNQPNTAGIWVYEDAQCYFAGNNIVDAKQHGVRIGSCNITFGTNNTINHPALRGIWIVSGSTGSANIQGNTVSNLNSGQPAYQNDAGGSMSVTVTGNSWQTGGGGGSGATFFQDYNYGGGASQLIPVGNYTLTQLAARGLPNDWASSLQLTSGRTVIMYSDDNFSGQSWTRTANTPNFGSLSPNANDMVSSVRVQ